MIKKSEGFSLPEVLIVIVILGIVSVIAIPNVTKLIKRSKTESRESLGRTLEMAAKSYAQSNTSSLPKSVGETTTITAKELKRTNYLKEDLVDSDDNSCMNDSVVIVYKPASNDYSYTPFLYCEGDDVPAEITLDKPVITVKLTDAEGNAFDIAKKNVSIPYVDIDIKGNSSGSIGVDGYIYSISVNYTDFGEEAGTFTEIYSSGSIKAGGKKNINIHKKLSEYVDISKVSNVKVKATAYNVIGGFNEGSGLLGYGDTDAPLCGEIKNESLPDVWDGARSRTISVKCIDRSGSGCVRDEYIKTFTHEADRDYITIEDNAGNKTNCSVIVHIDYTAPTVTVKAYQLNANGTKGKLEATAVANQTNKNAAIKQYTDGYGTDSWLNRANFLNGIYYEVTIQENLSPVTGTWSENEAGKKKGETSEITKKLTHSYPSLSSSQSFTITEEGWREGIYFITDAAGNAVNFSITAPYDRTNPSCVSSGGDTTCRAANHTLTGKCTDDLSGCINETIQKTFTTSMDVNNASPGDVSDKAGNITTCPGNQTVRIDKTPPEVDIQRVYFKKWINNSTRPSSISGLADTYTPGNWSNRRVISAPSGGSDSGCAGGTFYQYTTTGATTNHTNQRGYSRNIEANGKSTIKWRICDILMNCRGYTEAKNVWIDTVAPVSKKIAYKYRSSTYGYNDRCQMIPSSKCKFTATGKGNNARLVFKSGIDRNACLNEIEGGVGGWRDCSPSYADGSVSKTSDSLLYVGSIFSVNRGNSYIYLAPGYDTYDATSGVASKKIYFRDGVYPSAKLSTFNLYWTSSDGYKVSNKVRTMSTYNRGTTFKFVITDYAGNSSDWTVVFLFTGVAYHGDHWKYTPYNFDVSNKGFFAQGWTQRFYIRTFMDAEDVTALSSWSYYSDAKHPTYAGEGECDTTYGCQLHGWFDIDGHEYFFNTSEYSIMRIPDGSIVTNGTVRACRDSSYYLRHGYCSDTGTKTKYCDENGYCW